MAFVGGYRSRLSGGWFSHISNDIDYLESMTDGFWSTTGPIVNYSGDILGKGLIDNLTSLIIDLRIVGNINGKGKSSYRLNYSKTNALNPILKVDNESYQTKDCPIAAIEYNGFSPNKIINILDKSDQFYENTSSYYIVENIRYDTDHYPIKHYQYNDASSGIIHYLVSDYRSDNDNGLPLFYQYELLFDANSDTSENIISNIYKNNEIKVDQSKYNIEISDDLLLDGSGRYSDTAWKNVNDLNVNNLTKRVRLLLPMEFATNDDFYVVEYQKVVNGVKSYQKELIELNKLYTYDTDYYITDSGLYLTEDSHISNSNELILIKDPDYKIQPFELTIVKDQTSYTSYVSDAASSWNLRLNIGEFLRPSGNYTGNEESFYYLNNNDASGEYPVTNVKPKLYNSNILKVDTTPIYIDSSNFVYPNYTIGTYDKVNNTLTDLKGKISIDVNGVTRDDIKVLSVDTNKGFIQIDKNLSKTDEIELSYYFKNNSTLLVENLELNPKITDGFAEFNISGYMNTGIGIAIPTYDGTIDTTYPYIYNPKDDESSRVCTSLPPLGVLPITKNWTDNNFFTICTIDLNRLTTDLVKYTDCRKPGGGIDMEKIKEWYSLNYGDSNKQHEFTWYTDKGYYDGEPFSTSNIVMIHVPKTKLDNLKNKWISYYESNNMTIDEATKLGTKEFNYYLDQMIKRYISAGSEYILIPTVDGELQDIMILDV